MGRNGIVKGPKLLLRSWKQIEGRAMISNATKPNPTVEIDYTEDTNRINGGQSNEKSKEVWWVPHERTGIFFPVGQESVMDDVPDGAASFNISYWLRNVDGVDKPEP